MDRFALSIFNEFKSNHVTLSDLETIQLDQTVSLPHTELDTQDHFYPIEIDTSEHQVKLTNLIFLSNR